jgi:Flp pilus assembly secretin CpaC
MTSALTTPLRRLRRATNGRPATIAALVVAIIVILVATPQAQQMVPTYMAVPNPAVIAGDAPTDVDLLVGRSTVLNVGGPIARVSLTVPDIADAMVTAPTQLLIHGKQPGTISLFVWDRAGAIKTYEVKVRRDLTPLIAHVKQLFAGEPITVMGSGKDVVLSGTVSSKYVIEKAAEVAAGYVDKKENVVNLLKQQEGVASNQVMLRVRFAEVSRNALQELGGAVFSDGYNNQFGRITTQQFPAPFFDQQAAMLGKTLVFGDYLNLFLFDAKNQLGAVVKALQGRGVFQSLAEPNLIALNGKEASFLAGGEFPYPVPQGNFGSFSIQFKEYGVRLKFTPTVLGGDLINLKINPEVSSLDFNNAVVIEGFRIPALTSRRADLRDCRPPEQHGALLDAQDSRPGRHSSARDALQEPRLPEGSERAGRDGDSDHRAPRLTRRVAGPAVADRAVHGCAEQGDCAAGSLYRVAAPPGEPEAEPGSGARSRARSSPVAESGACAAGRAGTRRWDGAVTATLEPPADRGAGAGSAGDGGGAGRRRSADAAHQAAAEGDRASP